MHCTRPVQNNALSLATLTYSSMKNIVETAVHAGTFNTLVAAVQAAGLTETLATAGPFTVFAPTDEAFANLPAGTVEKLLENKTQLTNVLTYHVAQGKMLASDVIQKSTIPTLQGNALPVKVGTEVHIGNAKVTQTDILCSNGVIHVIDAVLLPA